MRALDILQVYAEVMAIDGLFLRRQDSGRLKMLNPTRPSVGAFFALFSVVRGAGGKREASPVSANLVVNAFINCSRVGFPALDHRERVDFALDIGNHR